ncbi:hypothetical protein MRX96_037322 [Rhipicephalus microplus]
MPAAVDARSDKQNRRPLASRSPVVGSQLSNQTTRRNSCLSLLILSLSIASSPCIFLFVAGTDSSDLVPNLCRLMDQPLYCRCDVEDFADDATDVFCYVTRPITPDHVVFNSFRGHASVVSLGFNALNLKHKLTFVPSGALRHCSRLERLKFTQSDLGALKTHSFYNLTRLAWLSLDSNAITNPGERMYRRPAASEETRTRRQQADSRPRRFLPRSSNPYSGLPREERDRERRRLRVRRSFPTTTVSPKWTPLAFEGLPQLNILYLAFNRLRFLPAQLFAGAPNLLNVDLSQNELLTLTWRTVQDLRKIDTESFHMGLIGNKFICDCRLAWVQRLQNVTLNGKFHRELRDITCCNDGASSNESCRTQVAGLSLAELQCHEDYETPRAAIRRHIMTRSGRNPAVR